jgi:hypothetical protein
VFINDYFYFSLLLGKRDKALNSYSRAAEAHIAPLISLGCQSNLAGIQRLFGYLPLLLNYLAKVLFG